MYYRISGKKKYGLMTNPVFSIIEIRVLSATSLFYALL